MIESISCIAPRVFPRNGLLVQLPSGMFMVQLFFFIISITSANCYQIFPGGRIQPLPSSLSQLLSVTSVVHNTRRQLHDKHYFGHVCKINHQYVSRGTNSFSFTPSSSSLQLAKRSPNPVDEIDHNNFIVDNSAIKNDPNTKQQIVQVATNDKLQNQIKTGNNIVEVNEEDVISSDTDTTINTEFWGIEKKQMTDEELQIPFFTGVIVLIFNLALIFYGFYVFFTGDDPAFDQAIF